ncbi:hypothetical protein C0995_000129 [Termitomyces sp. Mi166|nr:hypothetical protein C0995_000129 [Termitomyces sp. Mi166\
MQHPPLRDEYDASQTNVFPKSMHEAKTSQERCYVLLRTIYMSRNDASQVGCVIHGFEDVASLTAEATPAKPKNGAYGGQTDIFVARGWKEKLWQEWDEKRNSTTTTRHTEVLQAAYGIF